MLVLDLLTEVNDLVASIGVNYVFSNNLEMSGLL